MEEELRMRGKAGAEEVGMEMSLRAWTLENKKEKEDELEEQELRMRGAEVGTGWRELRKEQLSKSEREGAKNKMKRRSWGGWGLRRN